MKDKNKNLTEDNKLLAEFLDWTVYFNQEDTDFIAKMVNIKDLAFNRDWNQLMQVVEKIEEFAYVIIDSNQCRIYTKDGQWSEMSNDIVNSKYDYTSEFKIKIESVFNSCVKFVRWYNKQN